ncbi:MAG: sel1 repeat family protein [Deltaproteobacteria bacterium]|nr:sel1 repeat family protein [Deltaproteobacteria bacterium]
MTSLVMALVLVAGAPDKAALAKADADHCTKADGTADTAQACHRACDAGLLDSCHALAKLYDLGKGVELDAKRALSILRAACAKDHAQSCFDAGKRLLQPTSGKADEKHGHAMLEKACKLGIKEACPSAPDAGG